MTPTADTSTPSDADASGRPRWLPVIELLEEAAR